MPIVPTFNLSKGKVLVAVQHSVDVECGVFDRFTFATLEFTSTKNLYIIRSPFT